MRVVHIAESFAGGVYDFLVDLTNGMKDFEHFIVYGKRDNTPEDFEKDFPIKTRFFYWKSATREINPKRDFLALKELIDILKAIKKIDIIHLHSSKAGFIGRLAARILNLQDRVIYTSHGVSFLRKDISYIKKKQFELLEKIASKFGGEVVACSKSEADEFRKVGIKARFIFNGIDVKKYNIEKINKSKKHFIIGTVGRITYAKNPKMFNEIAKHFENREYIKFLWVGDGELKKYLVSSNIEVTGWLDKKMMMENLKQIDLYISTSLWEGLPLSALQAMSARKPLLLSKCVGNIDLVVEGVNGFTFETEEEAISNIERLINDNESLELLGENSFKILNENFTMEKCIKEYKALYESLTGIS